jgi:hypothetical protein
VTGHIKTPMTKVVLDKDPDLLKHWSSLNPMGRIGMIHELRGVMVWLLSDASTFCTGSESVIRTFSATTDLVLQYPGLWRTHRLVNDQSKAFCHILFILCSMRCRRPSRAFR